ncbi:MAG: hypothetical protein ABGY95_11695, partial [Rubritalea sp.]|uniref:tetratricopeptide repeat protein n=1 Tax=Rubritalea sp. TaxID=2109375 RepID=UPI00324264B1
MSEKIVEITEAELPHNLKTLWLKALSAEEMQNHTYAISLVNAVLKDSPGFLAGRQLARKCAIQVASASGKKKKSGGMTALLSGGVSSLKLASSAKKDPISALIQIEKELEKDPFEPQINDVLFDTAMRLNLLDTAAFALETVRKGAPENTKLMHKLAEHYLLRDMLEEATDVYNGIIKQDSGDIHAVKGAKDSSARASMKKQKWEDAQSIDHLKKDASQMAQLEASDRAAMTNDQQLEKLGLLIEQYHANQNDLTVVKDIAQLYENMENWKDAHAFYDWAYQISNGDTALKLKAGQIADRVANEKMKELEEQLEADPNND